VEEVGEEIYNEEVEKGGGGARRWSEEVVGRERERDGMVNNLYLYTFKLKKGENERNTEKIKED